MTAIDIRTGFENMDVAVVHQYLSEESYWAKGIAYELVSNSMKHSFCVGAFSGDRQIAFGRIITDYHTFGWYADFFVLPEFRGQGISKMLLANIADLAWVQRLRRIMLNTRDAHGLYRQFGFNDLANPTYLQEIYRPGIHLKPEE